MKYRNYYCTPRYSDKEQMYFGVVEGAPKIPTIEAETIDDFERLFHEAVDDYLERRQDAKRRAKWGIFIPLIAVVGILHTGVAYVLYFSAVDVLPAQTVASLSYIDPVVAILLSWLVFAEPLTLLGWLGAALILGATFVAN